MSADAGVRAVLFAGPSLAGRAAPLPEGIVLAPPVQQGDVFRALTLEPRAIGIVDGQFDGVPAVWHKEILFALARGVAVFGAASMGALRAAELDPFGMRGVGRVFAWYRDGVIEDDAEVALLHGPAATGYARLSEALVDVRATVEAAVEAGVVATDAAERVIEAAGAIFYKERTWEAILERAAPEIGADARAALAAFLPGGRFDQKRADAEALIAEMAACLARPPAPPAFRFAVTDMWERGVAAFLSDADLRDDPSPLDLPALLFEEARLGDALDDGVRHHAGWIAASDGPETPPEPAVLAAFRAERGLLRAADWRAFLAETGLTEDELAALLPRLAAADAKADAALAADPLALLAALKLAGRHGALVDRARRKLAFLRERGLLAPTAGRLGAFSAEVLEWHFGARGLNPPRDLEAHARRRGFADADSFLAALMREYAFVLSSDDGEADAGEASGG